MSITITPLAQEQIKKIKEAQTLSPETGVRITILGGGCSGMQYSLALEAQKNPEVDTLYAGEIPIITQRKFDPHLEGTVIDFHDTPSMRGFVIENPNFPKGSGCPGCGG